MSFKETQQKYFLCHRSDMLLCCYYNIKVEDDESAVKTSSETEKLKSLERILQIFKTYTNWLWLMSTQLCGIQLNIGENLPSEWQHFRYVTFLSLRMNKWICWYLLKTLGYSVLIILNISEVFT
jgi:transcriptional regulator of heat shock response